MSAPEIPNLRTLLGNRRGGHSRGRGRGRGFPGSSHETNEAEKDAAVKGTDQDAAGSRVSCVELGYLDDRYAKLFSMQQTVRRLPLLNRGTYVRTSAIDLLIDRFLTTDPNQAKQMISLGAGTDTRYFRLRDQYPNTHIIYHEIDFPSNTTAKLSSINRNKSLFMKLTDDPPLGLAPAQTSYYSHSYNVHDIDLRALASTSENSASLQIPNVSSTTPTLVLSEMCLIYLPAETTKSILNNILNSQLHSTTPASILFYEPIHPNRSSFGNVMIQNLLQRNIHLLSLSTYTTLQSQRQRLLDQGLTEGHAADMAFIWRDWVSEDEKERVSGLEMLDELEELELLLKHYCLAWGWRDGEGNLFRRAWREVREQPG